MTENIPTVLYEKDGRIARLTLNRPEKLNAINETMPDELSAAVARANEDDEVHVIVLSGEEAARIGLVSMAVPAAELDETVERLAERMAGVPKNQLMMQKLMINQAYENMGLQTTQMFATLFDGIARHTPEGVAFKAHAEAVGFKQAVKERDR